MVNYSITVWPATSDTVKYVSLPLALAALETKLETVDSGKTIITARVIEVNGGTYFVPYLIYTT